MIRLEDVTLFVRFAAQGRFTSAARCPTRLVRRLSGLRAISTNGFFPALSAACALRQRTGLTALCAGITKQIATGCERLKGSEDEIQG